MKNKDKYDLTKLKIQIMHEFNGCGKIIAGKNTLIFTYEDKEIARKKEKKEIITTIMEWLEDEDTLPM